MPDEFTRTGAAWVLRPVFPVERHIFMDHHNCLLVKFVFIFADLDIIFGYFYIIFSAFNIILGAFYMHCSTFKLIIFGAFYSFRCRLDILFGCFVIIIRALA